MLPACLPAYLLLEYVLLAQARPTMSCIALVIDILCIFATSGGVHALTQKPREKAWLRYVAATLASFLGPVPTETSSLLNHGKKAQEAVSLLLYSAPAPYVRAHLMPHVTILNSHFLGGAKLRLDVF